MDNKLIAQFVLNNKKYVFCEADNSIKFGYVSENGDILFDLTNDELTFMKSLMPKIIISKDTNNHVFVNQFIYNNKKYAMFIDKISGIKFFKEIINNEYANPNLEEIKELIVQFNDVNEISSIKKPKSNKFKKYVSTFISCGAISIQLFILTNKIIVPNQYNIEEEKDNSSTQMIEVPITFEEIISAISENPNLSDEEKKFFLSSPNFFNDNLKYFNRELVLKRLQTFKVNYKDSATENQYSRLVTGEYSFSSNEINILYSNSFDDANKAVLGHEFCHLFSSNYTFDGLNVLEGINEFMNFEYFNPDNLDISYLNSFSFVGLLGEIIGPEALRKTYATGDINNIVDGLTTVINDRDMAVRFLANYDVFSLSKTSDIDKETYQNAKNSLKDDLLFYYATCFNRSIGDDELASYYYDEIIAEKDNLFGIYDIDASLYYTMHRNILNNKTDDVMVKILDRFYMANYYKVDVEDMSYNDAILSVADKIINKKDGVDINNQLPPLTEGYIEKENLIYIFKPNFNHFEFLTDEKGEKILGDDGEAIVTDLVYAFIDYVYHPVECYKLGDEKSILRG